MNALDYFLKANLYGLLFVGFYWLLLRRHTFFKLNRIYLLASAVLSLALPLISLSLQTVKTIPLPTDVMVLPTTALLITAPVETAPTEPSPDWEQIGLVIYALIASLLLLRLFIRVGQLMQLVGRAPQLAQDDYVLVMPTTITTPTFSFFRYIILNSADVQTPLIINHELVHVRQRHSADVLGLAVLRAVFWACPALWLIDRALRQVHEFLADKAAHQSTDYARFLVEYAFGIQPDTLTNGFFKPSLLKQRLLMLHRNATTRWALGKYALILPLIFGVLAMTTAPEKFSAIVSQATEGPVTVSGRVTGPDGKALPGANVVVANTGKGTPTDDKGFYKLSGVPISATLAYSHIGYRTDQLRLSEFKHEIKNHRLVLSPRLTANLAGELPAMGATAVYKAIKPNPAMPVRTPPSSQTINDNVVTVIEEPAVFPTGVPGLMQYVAHHLHYPSKARATGIQGDVHVLFTVLPTGAISNVKINKDIEQIGGGCEEEAIRVVRLMPHWLPAKQNGKPVAVRYQIPIRFALDKNEDKRTGQINPASYSDRKLGAVIDSTINAKYGLSGYLKGKPLFLLNGKTELTSAENIAPENIERTEYLLTPKAQVLYGSKAANGVVIVYLKGAWQQDPAQIKKTFLDILSNPAKETEYHINQKLVNDKEVENLRLETIRAINWQRTPDSERQFDIIDIYTR